MPLPLLFSRCRAHADKAVRAPSLTRLFPASAGVRYAPAGDAPRMLQRRDSAPPGLVILDAALVEHAPPTDVRALVELLRPWLQAGGAALVAAPVHAGEWPWAILELAGGQLRPLSGAAVTPTPAWSAPVRMVAEGAADRVARCEGSQ